MNDRLYFGEDTTELRFQNELKQRSFIKAIPEHFDAIIQDWYDPFKGFTIKVSVINPEKYFSWLLSTEWYKYSVELAEKAKNTPVIVRRFVERSMKEYPSAWNEERIRQIINS